MRAAAGLVVFLARSAVYFYSFATTPMTRD
jgi:hypothetical protein